MDSRTLGSNGVLYNKSGGIAWDYYLAWRNSDKLAFDQLANSGKGISKDQQLVFRATLSFMTYVDDGSIVLMFESNGQNGMAKEIMEKNGIKAGSKVAIKGAGKKVEIKNDVLDSARTGSALKTDQYHAFNNIIDNYAGSATKTSLCNNATLYQLEGSLNGTAGRFEWIIRNGSTTHRMFVPRGTMNGVPIKP